MNYKDELIIERYIKKLVTESLEKMNFVPATDSSLSEKQGSSKKSSGKSSTGGKKSTMVKIRRKVREWLDNPEIKDSSLAYKLYPSKDKDSVRSLFSKKKKGEDHDFTNAEYVRLYNIRSNIKEGQRRKEETMINEIIDKTLKEFLR